MAVSENDLLRQIQVAKDMLEEVQNQRNAAQNECVKVTVALKAAQRVIAMQQAALQAYDADIAGLCEQPKSAARPNGHAAVTP